MKQFAEFLPIAVFAGVYFYTRDIFTSTAVLMAAMFVQVGVEYGTSGKVARQTWFIFGSVVVLGGMTLAFRDETFIQWKPTLVNWAFCVVLLGSHLLIKVNLLKKMLGEQVKLPDHAWRNLTFGWSLGFFIAGALNLIVAFNFDMDFWVSYKLVGGFALTLIYIAITMVYLVKGGFMEDDASELKAEAKAEVESKAESKPNDA
ncbi:MAG: intracellular septation protein [Candidatus Azotimanducaceae bacterium]|jgi:intracellular septation protein